MKFAHWTFLWGLGLGALIMLPTAFGMPLVAAVAALVTLTVSFLASSWMAAREAL